MSHLDHYGDADVQDAVDSIMKLGPAVFDPEGGASDKRPNKEDQDITEAQTSTDLEESEREERAAKAADKGDEAKEGEGGEKAAGADEEEFIELPPAEEGGEPLRVPLNEAAEAWQKMRQLDGDIATAVIKAEETAFATQDQIPQELSRVFATVKQQGEATLAMMQEFMPQMPDERLLDRNGQYYDPESYWVQRNYYDRFTARYHEIQGKIAAAEKGVQATGGQQESEWTRRETERAARYIPDFDKPEAREAKKAEWLQVLGPRYNLDKSDFDEITDHRALRMIEEHAKLLKAQTKAPEVRKHVQETKAKITKGRVLPDRSRNGQFIGDAFKQLQEHKSTDAAAAFLLRSGALKGL
jgi:hypothetical protein